MENQIKKEMTKLEIANDWIGWAKANFYHEQYGESDQYDHISDTQWNTFGKIMSYVSENWDCPLPSGTEERMYYRAFASMITEGPEGTKDMIGRYIDGKSKLWDVDGHVIQMIGYAELIFQK